MDGDVKKGSWVNGRIKNKVVACQCQALCVVVWFHGYCGCHRWVVLLMINIACLNEFPHLAYLDFQLG